jgi:large subunit ribosomal protein L18
VFRSNKNIYAQLINDNDGVTICAANSLQKGVFDGHGNTVDAAKAVGKKLGELAVEKGINEATLDRGSYQYHGRVLALADGAREAGLKL